MCSGKDLAAFGLRDGSVQIWELHHFRCTLLIEKLSSPVIALDMCAVCLFLVLKATEDN